MPDPLPPPQGPRPQTDDRGRPHPPLAQPADRRQREQGEAQEAVVLLLFVLVIPALPRPLRPDRAGPLGSGGEEEQGGRSSKAVKENKGLIMMY